MPFAHSLELVAYHDLEGRPGFKLALQEKAGRWYLYMGHVWHSGWTVLDVTDPSSPRHVQFKPGPPNTWTLQIQVADQRMITALEPIPPVWGGDPDGPPADEGIIIWDASDPGAPQELGRWRTGGSGTHRNYYAGGDLVHLAMGAPGHAGRFYGVLDISNPANPSLLGRWWWPGQHVAAGESFSPTDAAKESISLHGAPYVAGDRVYCPWSGAGMVILDISDVANPRLLGVLDVSPPLGSKIAVHSVVPTAFPGLVVLNSEALNERCDEPLNFAGVADVSDPNNPRLVSMFPRPDEPRGYGPLGFCARGGRFGPHNQHQPQGHPDLLPAGEYIFLTYFNAGLQVFDVSMPEAPRNAGYYIPDDPPNRIGPLPRDLVVQAEDVLVDRRGFVYMTEKNSGLYVLRFNQESV